MASVKRREDDRPKPWLVRWRDEAGAQKKKSFARKVDADRFRADVEHQLNTGAYLDPKAGRVTFEAYAERWRAMQPHRPNTAARTKSQLSKHVYPVLGRRPVAQLRHSELQAFVTALPLSPSSVRPVWATVRAILAAAKHDRLIAHDPAERIKLPELPVVEIVPLLVGQVDGLAAAMPGRYRGLVEFDAGSGLRQGEAFAVELGDIDFTGGSVKVERQLQPTDGGGVVICPLKNKHSYRTVPIGEVTAAALRAHLEAFPVRDVELLDVTGRKPVTRMARLVFTDDVGQALHRNRFNEYVWTPARDAAGLVEATMHDLRHFFASLLIRDGLSPKVVAKLLGHADASMTLRVYAHLWPDDEDRSRQAVDRVMRQGRAPHMRPSGKAESAPTQAAA